MALVQSSGPIEEAVENIKRESTRTLGSDCLRKMCCVLNKKLGLNFIKLITLVHCGINGT